MGVTEVMVSSLSLCFVDIFLRCRRTILIGNALTLISKAGTKVLIGFTCSEHDRLRRQHRTSIEVSSALLLNSISCLLWIALGMPTSHSSERPKITIFANQVEFREMKYYGTKRFHHNKSSQCRSESSFVGKPSLKPWCCGMCRPQTTTKR